MLRTFLTLLLVCLISAGLFLQTAEAKRFGGGRSFGISRSSSSFSHPGSQTIGQNYSRATQALGQSTSPMSRWLGPIAGLVAGGLIASLLMKHGLASGIMSLLVVGGLILALFALINFFRNRFQPAMQGYQGDRNNYFSQESMTQTAQNNTYSSPAPINQVPHGFDEQNFLRDAKLQFIRLQAAYDQKNLNDIREFTTPEVFAEIQLQMQERGNEENKTNVMTLEAELLGVENEIASVRFKAMMQENSETAAQVEETWNFRKDPANQHWLVAGVQQN